MRILAAVICAASVTGCVSSYDSMVPVGAGIAMKGGSTVIQPAQPVRPVQPGQPAPLAPQLPGTLLAETQGNASPAPSAEMEAKRYPPASEEDFTQIDGVREAHPGKSPAECQKLQLWFANKQIFLKLKIKSNPMPGNRKQVLCVFEGPNAIANRFGRYNDMLEEAKAPYPENNAGYPPNPYDAASDPLNCPPSGVCKYVEDPNHHDSLKQLPQPSHVPSQEPPFNYSEAEKAQMREEYRRRHPNQ